MIDSPKRIDIGCGPRKASGFIGVDISPGPGVDIVADLSQTFPFEESTIDEVRAHDVIEHLADRIHTMNEIWRVCKPGAKVDIRVPSSDGRGAFQDPTHISFWNINSFKYYCAEFPSYLDLCHQYGFAGAFKLLSLEHEESPENVIHVNAHLQVLKPVPQTLRSLQNSTQTTLPPNSEKEEGLIKKSKEISRNSSQMASQIALSKAILVCTQQYQKNPNDRAAISNLRRERQKFSEECLSLEFQELVPSYTHYIRPYHQVFFNSGIQKEKLTPKELAFVETQFTALTLASEQEQYVQHFLVLSLYCPITHLPLPNIKVLPGWFLPDYLKLLFGKPPHYYEIGDSDRHYKHFSKLFLALHQAAFQDKSISPDNIRQIAETANFIPFYFNENNLRDLYALRSDFLEAYLQQEGSLIDYEFSERPIDRKKIRLGILANHFDNSAETSSSLTIYEYISREFEVVLYTLRPPSSEMAQYCLSCANGLKVLPQSLIDQVDLIRADDLDLLFVGTNVTAVSNSLSLLALHRLARAQLTSVTSIATTGFRHMDYFLSGELTDSHLNAQNHYREQLLKVPGSVHCFSYGPGLPSSTLKIDREYLGIADGSVVYASGANFFKCIPELLHSWAKILADVPKSVMMMLPFGPNWSNNYPKQKFIQSVHNIFSEYGIESSRILVLDPQPVPNREDVKAYFSITDIYLDSYPVCGTTSLIEPLELNLPIVSRKGEYMRGSMGAAILEAMQLSNLVTDSESNYIQLATTLGSNTSKRTQIRHQIQRQMRANPPVLDSQRFGAIVGDIFKQLMINYEVNNLSGRFNLRRLNLLVFPDWNNSEDELLESLSEVIKAIALHPKGNSITLLLDGTGVDVEDANLIISSIAMNLMVTADDVSIYEKLELSLIESLSALQWKALLSKVQGRIITPIENVDAVFHANAQYLTQTTISSLNELNDS